MVRATRSGGGGSPLNVGNTIPQIVGGTSSSEKVAPAPHFSGVFSGVEKWFYENIGKPIEKDISSEIGPLTATVESDLPAMESELSSYGPELETLPGIAAAVGGVAATLAQKIPAVRHAESVIESDLSKVEQYGKDVVQEAPEVKIIEKDVKEIPTDLENFWDNYAMPDIRKLVGDISPELSTLDTDITNLQTKIKGLATDIENLPEDIESYVSKGVEAEFKKIWKKIEIPALALGGLWLWKTFYPSCPQCGTSHPKGKHIKKPAVG